PTSCAASRSCSRRAKPLPEAIHGLEARLSELAGAPVQLERPSDPAHGDYATNVALRVAPARGKAPRELAEELVTAATGLNEVERFRAPVAAIRRGEEPPEDGYRGEYVAALASEESDPVAAMLKQIEATLERFRIHFDSWALQSELETRLP